MPANHLSVVAVGDVIPMRPLFGESGEPAGADFARVVDLIGAADVAVCNADMPLTERGHPKEKLITIRGDPALAPDLRRMGFHVVSMANNHVMDYGDVGMSDTVDAYAAAGLTAIGAGPDLAAATAPAIVEANGWRVGVLTWTCVLPTGASAAVNRPGQAPMHVHTSYQVDPYMLMEEPGSAPTVRSRADDADLAAASSAIASLRGRVDFLVVLVHWGRGMSDELAEYQRPLGRALLDAGADVVVGSHPHRVLGIEEHGGKLILYSPGTLIEQLSREGVDPATRAVMDRLSPDSFVATLDVAPGGGYSVRITPTTLGPDRLPSIATGDVFARIRDRLVWMSAALDTTVHPGDDALTITAPATGGVPAG